MRVLPHRSRKTAILHNSIFKHNVGDELSHDFAFLTDHDRAL